ncbi:MULTISPECIES: hypothetical protein [unclassified Bradyrhizobium]|uniref:hypothetical protein n=1 Tax=unclassified Bradyrhizobium TaxID=2631580 RepID=UPI002FF1D222
MRSALAFPLALIALQSVVAAHAQGCVADRHGGLVCGEGKAAMRVFADTTSPSKDYAFAWRTAQGLPSGQNTPDDVENVLIRVTDGAVLTTLGGTHWETGEMRANRYELLAAWSPDSRAVIGVANSRWESDSFAYYRIDGETATKLDLRALVEPHAVVTGSDDSEEARDGVFMTELDGPIMQEDYRDNIQEVQFRGGYNMGPRSKWGIMRGAPIPMQGGMAGGRANLKWGPCPAGVFSQTRTDWQPTLKHGWYRNPAYAARNGGTECARLKK